MQESQDKRTTAENLEQKFGRGEDVLDYFDLRKARIVDPQSKVSDNEKFAYPVKQNSTRRVVIREKSVRDRKKK